MPPRGFFVLGIYSAFQLKKKKHSVKAAPICSALYVLFIWINTEKYTIAQICCSSLMSALKVHPVMGKQSMLLTAIMSAARLDNNQQISHWDLLGSCKRSDSINFPSLTARISDDGFRLCRFKVKHLTDMSLLSTNWIQLSDRGEPSSRLPAVMTGVC